MLTRLIPLTLLALAATIAGSHDTGRPARENPSGSSQDSAGSPGSVVPAHDRPKCNYPGSSCVWGQLWDVTAGQLPGMSPMHEGPIDVCHYWDTTCSSPVQTVCELHGPHGIEGPEGSYFFVLPTNRSWRIRPRVAGSHLSWAPPESVVQQGAAEGDIRTFNFALLGTAPSTDICD